MASFAKTIGDRYGKKLMDTATKTGKNTEMDAAKAASKRIVQKTAEATDDLNRNKIADNVTSANKSKGNKSKTMR